MRGIAATRKPSSFISVETGGGREKNCIFNGLMTSISSFQRLPVVWPICLPLLLYSGLHYYLPVHSSCISDCYAFGETRQFEKCAARTYSSAEGAFMQVWPISFFSNVFTSWKCDDGKRPELERAIHEVTDLFLYQSNQKKSMYTSK